jgi:hypothetical protein
MAFFIAIFLISSFRHHTKELENSILDKESTMDKVSDKSFMRLEKLCENTFTIGKENLLKDIEIPDLNETLDEVNFILSLGNQLKEEGKIKFPTPPSYIFKQHSVKTTITESVATSPSADMSVLMSASAQSSPKSSNLKPKQSTRRLSKVISPIQFSNPTPNCRNNMFAQVNAALLDKLTLHSLIHQQENFMSPTIK